MDDTAVVATLVVDCCDDALLPPLLSSLPLTEDEDVDDEEEPESLRPPATSESRPRFRATAAPEVAVTGCVAGASESVFLLRAPGGRPGPRRALPLLLLFPEDDILLLFI